MFKNKNIKAFTLIELLVWIAIISILLLSASSIDFNRLNSKQKLEIFTNEIKTNFERVRNNSLAWKWVWTNLIIPDKWVIEYSKTNSWTVTTKAYSWSSIISSENLLFKDKIYISQIKYWNINQWPITELSSWTWIIEIIWWNLNLTWSINSNNKLLQIEVTNKLNSWTILINTVNWLVEIK